MPIEPGQGPAGTRANQDVSDGHPGDLRPAPGQRFALVEAPLALLPPVEGDGHHGPMGRQDSQGEPFPRHGPSQPDPHLAPDPILQAVHQSGFEPVRSVSQPGPAVIPILGFIEPQSGVGRASGQAEGTGAAPLTLFPGQHSMAGSTPSGKEDGFEGATGFPGPVEVEAAGHAAGKMVGPGAPLTVVMCPSRFSLLP